MWYIVASMRVPSSNLEFKVIHNQSRSFFEITLFDKSKTKSQESISRASLVKESFDIPYALIGVIRISKSLIPEYGEFFTTMGSNAEKGYGPLLYDKAIEVASENGSKLINHATAMRMQGYENTDEMSSQSATNVWNKYKERKDVTKHDLGNDYFALSKDPNQKYFYE